MLIFLAGLQGIPTELYEAAKLDGAVAWRLLQRIEARDRDRHREPAPRGSWGAETKEGVPRVAAVDAADPERYETGAGGNGVHISQYSEIF